MDRFIFCSFYVVAFCQVFTSAFHLPRLEEQGRNDSHLTEDNDNSVGLKYQDIQNFMKMSSNFEKALEGKIIHNYVISDRVQEPTDFDQADRTLDINYHNYVVVNSDKGKDDGNRKEPQGVTIKASIEREESAVEDEYTFEDEQNVQQDQGEERINEIEGIDMVEMEDEYEYESSISKNDEDNVIEAIEIEGIDMVRKEDDQDESKDDNSRGSEEDKGIKKYRKKGDNDEDKNYEQENEMEYESSISENEHDNDESKDEDKKDEQINANEYAISISNVIQDTAMVKNKDDQSIKHGIKDNITGTQVETTGIPNYEVYLNEYETDESTKKDEKSKIQDEGSEILSNEAYTDEYETDEGTNKDVNNGTQVEGTKIPSNEAYTDEYETDEITDKGDGADFKKYNNLKDENYVSEEYENKQTYTLDETKLSEHLTSNDLVENGQMKDDVNSKYIDKASSLDEQGEDPQAKLQDPLMDVDTRNGKPSLNKHEMEIHATVDDQVELDKTCNKELSADQVLDWLKNHLIDKPGLKSEQIAQGREEQDNKGGVEIVEVTTWPRSYRLQEDVLKKDSHVHKKIVAEEAISSKSDEDDERRGPVKYYEYDY